MSSRLRHRCFQLVGASTLAFGSWYAVSEWRTSTRRVEVREPDGRRIWLVEVADSARQRATGLSGRRRLKSDGLVLIFPTTDRHGIWMRDMHFPLDLLWVDELGYVVYVLRSVPPCRRTVVCPTHIPQTSTAKYVLELRAGSAEAARVGEGARVLLTSPR